MSKEQREISSSKREPAVEASQGFSFRRLWNSFKKFWWISVAGCLLLTSLSFAYFHITFQPRYQSNVRFTITPLISSDSANGASVYSFNYNSTLSKNMAATFPYIIQSGIMTDVISNDLQRPFDARVSAVAVSNTNIFEIAVTSSRPQDAYDVLNSIIKNYPKAAEYVIGDTKMNVINGSEPVLATEPYNTGEYYRYVAFFGVVGILIGIGIALLDMYTKKLVTGKHDIEQYFNTKCLCEIPAVAQKRTSKANSMIKLSPTLSGFSESMRVLKQRVRLNLRGRDSKIIGITSSVSGEGKTTIAYNLAKALSGNDSKVLLLDMDLHNRSLQSILNHKNEVENVGITEVVRGKKDIGDVINSLSDTLDVLFAGEESVKFKKQRFEPPFELLRREYDFIVVDLPVCSAISETVNIANLCDELLFVVRANAVTPDKVRNAIQDMSFSDVHIIGFVVNGVDPNMGDTGYKYYGRYGKRRYGYGYGYGYSHYRKDKSSHYMQMGMSPHHSDFGKDATTPK